MEKRNQERRKRRRKRKRRKNKIQINFLACCFFTQLIQIVCKRFVCWDHLCWNVSNFLKIKHKSHQSCYTWAPTLVLAVIKAWYMASVYLVYLIEIYLLHTSIIVKQQSLDRILINRIELMIKLWTSRDCTVLLLLLVTDGLMVEDEEITQYSTNPSHYDSVLVFVEIDWQNR